MTTKIHALIVAAGKGARFGSSVPKQYLSIANKSVLEHSIDRLNHADIHDLTLVVAKDDERAKDLNVVFDGEVYQALGGDERWQSVANGVRAIRQMGACDDDWVLIHDAARPFLPRADLQALIQASQSTDSHAVILASPVVDTLKSVQDGTVIKTVSRDGLWQALTPQMFRLSDLQTMLDVIAKQGMMITDEASGFEILGQGVQVVQGSRLNIKLTYPDDLVLLTNLLEHAGQLLDD